MDIVKNFDSFISEKYQLPNSGSWLVYSSDKKVIGCDLTLTDAKKLSTKNGNHKIVNQDSLQFNSLEKAQEWLTAKAEENSNQDLKIEEIKKDPIHKQIFALSNLLKRRFNNINPFFFAYWIGTTFGATKFVCISKIETSQYPQDVKWCYSVIGNYYFDINGYYTKEELMEKEGLNKWNITDYSFVEGFDFIKKLKNDTKDLLTKKQKAEVISTILQFKNNIKK